MRGWAACGKSLFFLSLLATSCTFATSGAIASPSSNSDPTVTASHGAADAGRRTAHGFVHGKVAWRGAHYARSGGISCVPFARNASGIAVPGNAWEWWDNAAGVYERGSVPEQGSVLTFRSNGRMHLGHVAVVSRVINPREVEVEHANWWGGGMRGGVARNISVVDVSEANDWSAVRVEVGASGQFGSVYPTYGFIYDRPDSGKLVATAAAPAPQADLNPAPSDLRPAAERGWQTYEEVAEAPAVAKHHRKFARWTTGRVHQVATLERR
ncbi:MAG TPA: CHAP domain-containing protein [Acetobacteraceae bacterium]|nr:CHAP domain-containing protein [Acetobacteraceae bacterium]